MNLILCASVFFQAVFKYCPTPSPPTRVSSPRTPPLTADQTQLWPAIDLLMASIRDHAREHQSRQYAMQLLNLSLAYVNRLVGNATETLKLLRCQDESGLGFLEGFHLTQEGLEDALQRLMTYIKEMWVYLNGCPKWIGEKQVEAAPSGKGKTEQQNIDLQLQLCSAQLAATAVKFSGILLHQ